MRGPLKGRRVLGSARALSICLAQPLHRSTTAPPRTLMAITYRITQPRRRPVMSGMGAKRYVRLWRHSGHGLTAGAGSRVTQLTHLRHWPPEFAVMHNAAL